MISRRKALSLAAGLGVLPIISQAQNSRLDYKFDNWRPNRKLDYTPSLSCTSGTANQPEGPFYSPRTPRRELLKENNSGVPLILTGLVLTPNCKPVRSAVLDFWQCDEKGQYDNTGYIYRGHQFTDENGHYRLITVRPGLYPGRTSHIHVKLQGPKTHLLTTQLYFPDLPERNFFDRFYRDDLLIQLTRSNDGWKGRFDFVIQNME
jgi:protocatechuate 3,4-dioxygenase beta subunit